MAKGNDENLDPGRISAIKFLKVTYKPKIVGSLSTSGVFHIVSS